MSKIKLQCNDKVIVEVDLDIARMFTTLRTMIDLGVSEKSDEPIPLQNISSPILSKVIEWSKFHQSNPNGEVLSLCQWDKDFLLKLDQNTVFEIIWAANYLDIEKLVNVGCQFLADEIKNKTPEEIREKFNIKNDFEDDTPEV